MSSGYCLDNIVLEYFILTIIWGHICLLIAFNLTALFSSISGIAFSCYKCWVYLNLELIFIFLLSFMMLTLLKSTEWLFCGMSLILYLTNVAPQLDFHYALLGEVSQMWCCVFLSASSSSRMICPCVCPVCDNFSHLVNMVHASFSAVKLLFFFIYNSYVSCWRDNLRYTCAVSYSFTHDFSIHQMVLTETVIAVVVAKW